MSLFESSPPLRTKICGVTTPEDAKVVIAAGADAIGLNFFPGSIRYIQFEKERGWIEPLKGKVDRVAVVANASAAEVAKLVNSGCFEWIQFHGDETPAFCEQEGGPNWIRAIRVKDQQALDAALEYKTHYILCDAWSDKGYGGTGTRLNWDLIRDFVIGTKDRHIILAGGLTPTNVRDAVRIVRPHAVDVASGVELERARKNEYLVREFIHAAVWA